MEVSQHRVDPNQSAEIWPLLVDNGGDRGGRGTAVHDIGVLGEVEHPSRWDRERHTHREPETDTGGERESREEEPGGERVGGCVLIYQTNAPGNKGNVFCSGTSL